jgi:Dolichyl-phosphate-mannose-protein mannosyltransferase
MDEQPAPPAPDRLPPWCLTVVAASALLGLALIADQARQMSATFDEVTYLRVAAHWWRTGEQGQITRLGTGVTSLKLQLAPTFWTLDRLSLGAWIDDSVAHQEQLLPIVRIGASWFWLLAMLLAANWARQLYGPSGMAMASVAFALSPNLLAHGSLVTMEMPLLACSSAMLYYFWLFLKSGRSRDFWASAALGGLGMSLKFTMVLIPPILALLWAIDLGLNPARVSEGEQRPGWFRRFAGIVRRVGVGMVAFGAVMVASNLVVTGFTTIPLSEKTGHHSIAEGLLDPTIRHLAVLFLETPLPNDWVGFYSQMMMQKGGGLSYLMGEVRKTGWTHYYLVALAIKVPLAFWLLVIARAMMKRRSPREAREWVLPVFIAAFLLLAMFGSKRNFGYRYVLPIEAPAIVWASGLAGGGRWSRWLAVLGVAGMGLAVGSIHPHELTYFNEVAGGPIGGRKILSDSNFDWGQGARSLARLQRSRPELCDLTLFYFGTTNPAYYGVAGRCLIFQADTPVPGLPPSLTVDTKFLAVSASLQWGPWAPPGYFQGLDEIAPIAYTDDWTIAIYRASDLRAHDYSMVSPVSTYPPPRPSPARGEGGRRKRLAAFSGPLPPCGGGLGWGVASHYQRPWNDPAFGRPRLRAEGSTGSRPKVDEKSRLEAPVARLI